MGHIHSSHRRAQRGDDDDDEQDSSDVPWHSGDRAGDADYRQGLLTMHRLPHQPSGRDATMVNITANAGGNTSASVLALTIACSCPHDPPTHTFNMPVARLTAVLS